LAFYEIPYNFQPTLKLQFMAGVRYLVLYVEICDNTTIVIVYIYGANYKHRTMFINQAMFIKQYYHSIKTIKYNNIICNEWIIAGKNSGFMTSLHGLSPWFIIRVISIFQYYQLFILIIIINKSLCLEIWVPA